MSLLFAVNRSELSGALKSITDPFSYEVHYTNDKTARPTAVSGAALAQHANGNYADNIKYRAFGATKQIDYKLPSSQTASIKMDYDSALRVSHSEAAQPGSTTSWVTKADFSYLADGRLSAKDDLLNNAFDRTSKYDFAGRLSFSQFGVDLLTSKRVYQQAISYDNFSQMSDRSTTYWDQEGGFGATYTNGRITSLPAPSYDAAGNIYHSSEDDGAIEHWSYFDASGRQYGSTQKWTTFDGTHSHTNWIETRRVFDGDGRAVIQKTGNQTTITTDKYEIYSSVLGKVISTIQPSGTSGVTNIYAGGTLIAVGGGDSSTGGITWKTADPVTGTVAQYSYGSWGSAANVGEENEPLGQKISQVDPYPTEPVGYGDVLNSPRNAEWMCTVSEARGSGFWEMPAHCQQKILENYGSGLPEYLGVHKVESPGNIAHGREADGRAGGSGPQRPELRPGEKHSPEELARLRAIAATGKFDNEGGDAGSPLSPDVPMADASVGPDPDPGPTPNRKSTPPPPQPPSWDQMVEVFKACVNEWWGGLVTVNSATAAGKGVDGRINVTYLSGDLDYKTDTIFTDTSLDADSIEYKIQGWTTGKWPESLPTAKGAGITFPEGTKYISGTAYHFTPLRNYVASNVAAYRNRMNNPGLRAIIGDFETSQFHEGANSIEELTGVYIGDKRGLGNVNKDTDSGQRITDCMAARLSNGR